MSFSGTTVEQRSKEVEALKSFLTYSLIGSLALHIGALSSGMSNFLTRVPEGEEEPIEFAIVDSPAIKPEKPAEEIPEQIKKQPEVAQKQPEVAQKQPIVTAPVQKVVEKLNTPPVQQQPEKTTAVTEKPQPTNIPPKAIVTKPLAPIRTEQGGGGSNIAVPSSNPGGSGSGVPLGTGTGVALGTGTGTGTGTSTGSGTGTNSTVATAPTPPRTNSSGSGNGRAACRECAAKYPEAARRRGVEGRVEVAVDTDAQGNVTNVRVAKSSGNRDLDEETLRQARDWKLKPADGGRQGVSIATEYAIQGSRRHRQAQEQKKRREAQERNQQTTATNTNSTEGTRRRRRSLTPTITDVPAEKPVQSRVTPQIRRPKVENTAAGSSPEARTTRTPGNARESLRSIRREQVSGDSSQKPQTTTNRRRRKRENNNQNSLLRRLRPQPQSQPAAPPAGTTQE